MSEPGWTHLESSDSEPELEAEIEGYAVDAAAIDAESAVADSVDELDDVEAEAEAEDDSPPAASRVQAMLAGVGKGASFALQTVGRMSPRTRIGVASGLSVLALAGALATRGTGKSAPKNQIGGNPTTAKQDGDVGKQKKTDLAKANQPEKNAEKPPAAKPELNKNQNEHLADVVPPSNNNPASEIEKKTDEIVPPPVDPQAEKLPALGAIPDQGTVLAAASTKNREDENDVDLPLPSSAGTKSVPKHSDDPLPDADSGDPASLKLSGRDQDTLPDSKPAVSPLVEVESPSKPDMTAGGQVAPLPPIGENPGKLPAPVKSPVPEFTAAELPKPGSETKAVAGAEHPPLSEPSAPDSEAPAPNEPAAPGTPPAISPGLPAVTKSAAAEPLPSGKTPEPIVPDTGSLGPQIDSQGLPLVQSALPPPVEPVASPPAKGVEDMPKPSTDLIPSAPKEFPKITVGAAGGALAGGAAAAATTTSATAIPQRDKPRPLSDSKPESASDEPVGVPIRNVKASRPHDLNASDDPRGDDSLALFDSGPDTSAVSPSPTNSEGGDKDRRFEIEAPIPKTKGRIVQAEPDPNTDRVEAVYHQVASGENFWTISRLYYGSGRYFVALWGANKKTVPVMDQLHTNQVIVVPAQEDLDPALIKSAQSYMASTSRSPKVAEAKGDRRDSRSVAEPVRRPLKASGVGIDVIADNDDDDFAARSGTNGRARSRERDIDDGLDRVSDTRSNRDADLPIHKVRPRETLRSIARDRLGDSRRANEILRLNRGLIDDPTRLVAGQVIELPEDAKPGRR